MKKEENKKSINIQFITCPVCGGLSYLPNGRICNNCNGIGLGAFKDGQFFYFGLVMTPTAIKLRALKKTFHLILGFSAYAFGLLGLFFLTLWLWGKNAAGLTLEAYYFWEHKHPFLLIFWLSIIADMFVVYRLSETVAQSKKIKKRQIGRSEKPAPNNWKELKVCQKTDVADGFSQEAIKTVEDALDLAIKLGSKKAEMIHLFWALLKDSLVGSIFARLNVDGLGLVERVKNRLAKVRRTEDADAENIKLSNELKTVLIESYLDAAGVGQRRVEAANFIIPCHNHDENIKEILYDLEIDKDKIVNSVKWFRINEQMLANYKAYRKMARYKPDSAMDRAYTAVAAPILSHYSYDLTRQAKWGRLGLCVAREAEIQSVFDKFLAGHSGVILVGETGVGKNTIIGGIAQLMVKEEVPNMIKDKRLVELDVARLVSGANPAEAQARLLAMLDEIINSGNIVLYIKNIENMIGIQAGEGESLDLSEVLSDALEKSNLFCIASVNLVNYTKYVEGRAIGDCLARVPIDEPESNQAIQILESKVGYMENKYQVYFSYSALEETVKLSARYIHDKYLPAKAIDILEAVALSAAKERGKNSIVDKDDVSRVISEITDIPVDRVSAKEGQALLNLEEKIHQRMVGQEEAVKMISESLRRARVEMRDGQRPIANFLFLGPTGVGKTELAKTVAAVYFGDEADMIRVDMSEYQRQDSINKMIGEGEHLGHLTEAVRQKPFSLVLLDEFEKAHPDILNLFLQVMDDGRLTDGQGRTIDFTNCIIIATSNAGALFIQEEIIKGTDTEKIKQVLINEQLNKIMRPELINRFDGLVVFKPLTEEDVEAIAKLMLGKIGKMLDNKGIIFEASDGGIKVLVRAGFDPKFGARPLRRVLQERVENIIANKMLAGEMDRRDKIFINEAGEIEIIKGREL